MTSVKRYKQNSGIPAREVGGVLAVITPGTSNIHRLNEVGAWLWRVCEGEGRTVDELVEGLVARYEVGEAQARVDVLEFLVQASKKNILVCFE